MRKILPLLIFTILLALSGALSGCTTVTSGSGQGVELNFLLGNPPTTIYENSPLNIVVELRNKGTYPDPNERQGAYFDGKLYIYGYDSTQIQPFFPQQLPSDFYGKQSDMEGGYTDGSYTTVSFTSSSVQLPTNVNSADTKILATACYRYQTVASPVVCVDPDPFTTKIKSKPCTIDQVRMSSQYAPVIVTSVKEMPTANNIKFKIGVSNAGGGIIVEPSNLNNCPHNLDYTNTNIIYVSGELSTSNLYCDNNGKLQLSNGIGTIICTANRPAEETAFQAPLKIKLDYVYSKTIQTNLKILNTPQ